MFEENKLFYWSEAKRELRNLIDNLAFSTMKPPAMIMSGDDAKAYINAMIAAYNGGVMALRKALVDELMKEMETDDAGGTEKPEV